MLIYITLFFLGLCSFFFRKQISFFLAIFYIFYISCTWDAMVRLPVQRSVHKWWSQHVSWLLNCKFIFLPDSKPLNKKERTMFLVNHTSVADFFIHDMITEHSANFLSRMLVAIVFPLAYVLALPENSVWYFIRGGRGEKLEKFFQWCDKNFENPKTVRRNLLVYPEGHRNFGSEKHLPLKKGMIRYAFERKMKLQIIMSFGNELMLNEKNLYVNYEGNNVITFIDDVIDPANYKTNEEFYEFVDSSFEKLYKIVFAQYKKTLKH